VSDGVFPGQNVFGNLNVKADREVTDNDLQKCHLVLIGTEEQNSLVARLAPQLPVRWIGGRIKCSDGLDLDGTNRVLDLVHYNPLAPQRLIQWVASDMTNGYASHTNIFFQTGTDLVIKDGAGRVFVVARSFDSRWRWDPARANSSLIPANLVGEHDWNVAIARALQRGTGADFVFAGTSTNTSRLATLETMRLADVEALVYRQPVCLMDLTGTELLLAEQRRNTITNERVSVRLYPDFAPEKIQPDRNYRVAVTMSTLAPAARTFKLNPRSFRITDLETADILERFLLPDGNESDSKN
jgi:hypothetical protein